MNFTFEQLMAINEDNKNIIVSAGAGSGKTAVLSERVIRKLKEGVSIDELLILTFTRAAAIEMKERIRKKIIKNELLSNLDKLDGAFITTFDSFALNTIKKYHYLLNISKDIGICDSNIINLKKREIIEDVFNELYLKEDNDFIKLINDFVVKDDTEIKENILNIYQKISLLVNKEDYLNNYCNNHYTNDKLNFYVTEYMSSLMDKVKECENIFSKLSGYLEEKKLEELNNSLEPFFNSNSYEEIKINSSITLPKLAPNSEEDAKNLKKQLNDEIKKINKQCIYTSTLDIKDKILATKLYVKVIVDILKELNIRLTEYKKKNEMYEFIDIAIESINLIKNNEFVRNELMNSFKEIMIDEYQDTNDLQEEFINLISNNNVYMVGDIKQSIYRFRNANPSIFKDKYELYSKNELGLKIDLNKNFRSREENLSDINLIFNSIMDNNIGGCNYSITGQLSFGNNNYTINNNHYNNHLEIYNYYYDKSVGYNRKEIEAFIILKDIKDKIDNKYLVMDKETNTLRNIAYSDFVILIDRSNSFELYRKIFEYYNIPLTIYKDDSIKASDDLYIMKNIFKLLELIKNKDFAQEFKYCYMSVARSFLVASDDNIIFDNIITNKILNDSFIKKLSALSQKIDYLTIRQIIDEIIITFNYYEKLLTINNVNESIVRLDYLKELATNINNYGYTYHYFIDYLDSILKSDNLDLKISLDKDDGDSVKIMTIHKSKGLEYPICYFPEVDNNFNTRELTDKFLYDNELGIISPFFNEGINYPITKELLRTNYYKEEISEKIRLFYVALTRAREKMIIVTDFTKEKNIIKDSYLVSDHDRLNYKSFLDILLSIKLDLKQYTKNIDLEQINLTKKYNSIIKLNYDNYINKSDFIIKERNLGITSNIINYNNYAKKTNEVFTDEEKELLEDGKKSHYYFELLDLKNDNSADLTDNTYYISKLKAFLQQDFLKDINKYNIYKEYEFCVEEDAIVNHGVIDLMLVSDQDIIIIDYKLKNIDDENYSNQLKGYKNYIVNKFNKKVKIYLYSIINEKFNEIKS